MGDVKEIAKKYWPYLVGGIVGLYLIFRFMGGNSAAGSSGGSDYAAFLQAQSAAAQSNAQLQAQMAAQQAQIDLNNKQLDIQKMAVQADAFNNFTTAQANMAQAVGTGTAATINALNAPALAAMQSNAYENAAALSAAANVAAAGFMSQGNMVAASSGVAGSIARAIGSIQIPNAQQQEGKVGQAINYGGRAVAAYYTAGGSEVMRSQTNTNGSANQPSYYNNYA